MFQWNFTGGQNAYDAAQQAAMKQKAAMDMQGYAPNGSEATYAAQNMQGYNPNNSYLGRVSDRAGQPGSGQGYQFSDPEFEQYQQSQAKAEQEAAQKEDRINQIKSEISSLQQSIAEKEARLKNFTGSVDEIAALEAEKINSQDPTMIWRWQKQREDTSKANSLNNQITANKFTNEANALLKTEMPETYAEQVQQLKNVRMKIAEGKTIGADTSALEEQERALSENVEATHANEKAVKSAKSKISELKRQMSMKTITPVQYRDALKSILGTFNDEELENQLYTEILGGDKAIGDSGKADAKKAQLKSLGYPV